MRYPTPLRYPGGKSRLANFFKLLLRGNDLLDCNYAEPYAGGAGVAMALLLDEYVSHVHINDLSKPVYAFWYSVLNHTEELCERIMGTRITVGQWRRQKAVIARADQVSLLDLGFATFFVNRTTRSGIIAESAGVIGGLKQAGTWTLDARFNRNALADRIRRIAFYKDRISVYNLDAARFLKDVVPSLSRQTLVYLDPPYYVSGKRLYTNSYTHAEHEAIARRISCLRLPWVVSYDDVPEIRRLYRAHRKVSVPVPYSANDHLLGSEVLFLPAHVKCPRAARPARLRDEDLRCILAHGRRRDHRRDGSGRGRGLSSKRRLASRHDCRVPRPK